MCFKTLQKNKDCSLLLLRLVIGAIFLAHGHMKWSNFDGTLTVMNILAIAEPLGGVAMIVGLLTRWAGLGLVVIMLGAIQMKFSGGGLVSFATGGKWEFDLLILAACVMVMTMGPGKYALDVWAKWDKA
ncbi:MAG: DoxX family protein [Candidatus Peribacteraceae bacterium]|nr:DoxX family protein [Candidatus Peribacteraceae bacterium]